MSKLSNGNGGLYLFFFNKNLLFCDCVENETGIEGTYVMLLNCHPSFSFSSSQFGLYKGS